ncbi:hypothetical protein J3A69_001922 [Pseudomonas putida]|nr:hypothetical protein L483_19570 [Pseudomonas putida H8234]MBP2082774.1 hypothetical protein [Pseudomonas sp. PvP089]MBP2091522.1 hypothetical protein [Pseudomonas sp. PvP088]MBP2222315.1 hypothetical protein [Pseudomonas putida]
MYRNTSTPAHDNGCGGFGANPRHIARAGRQHRDSFERRFPMLSGMAFE